MTGVVPPPNSALDITKDGKPYKVFMSFGLLNQITRHLGDINLLPMLAIDPELQEKVLLDIFTERDEKGNVVKVPSLHEINVSLEDVDLILDFVGEHIASFFERAAEKAQKRGEALLLKLQARSASMPTNPGSPTYPSSTPAA